MFSYDITWGATKKEVERSNFWQEVPKIIKRFRVALIISFIMVFVMIILTTSAVPIGWRIFGWDWAVIVPLAYVLPHSFAWVTCADTRLLRIVVGCHILYPVRTSPSIFVLLV